MARVTRRGKWAKLKKGDCRRRLWGRKFKYVVTESYVFKLDHNYPIFKCRYNSIRQEQPWEDDLFIFNRDELLVLPGYLWDGASGPAIDTRSSMTPSLMHDCAYQSMRMGQWSRDFRKPADSDFEALLESEGMNSVWAKIRYLALRAFGGYAAKGVGPRLLER